MDPSLPVRLSSLSSALDDLAQRLTMLTEENLDQTDDEDIVRAMEEIERSVRSGSRRLHRLVRELERRR
ncbi:MAG: hypothetical protein OEY23_20285 [Acidimicrobiia bacterium]|nr:hypothetical protein [Acidimicrobiia bacterium]